jgi:hypothetical protein
LGYMIFEIFAEIIGVASFLFIFWKKLKEDYSSVFIFTTSFYVLGSMTGFALAAKYFAASWLFWATFAGSLVGLFLGVLRFKLRFFESYEALTIGLLPWLSLYYLSYSIKASSIYSFIAFVFMVFLMGLYYYLDKHYKSFSWYRSGRIGFSGLSVSGVFFLMRAAVASFFPFVISFLDKYEAILSGVTAFVFFLLTFNLARKSA